MARADRLGDRRSGPARGGATGAEIDFVGPALGTPFECKYADGSWRREALTIRARRQRGVMVTRSPLLTGPDEPVWAIPAGILAWLLGH